MRSRWRVGAAIAAVATALALGTVPAAGASWAGGRPPWTVAPGWTAVPVPGAAAAVAQASASDPTHLWAVGTRTDGGPLVLRSADTGATWSQVGAGVSWQGSLTGVTAVSPTQVWAIGADSGGLARVLRFDGAAWADVAFPGRGTAGLTLTAIDARPGGVAWIIGHGPSGSVLLRATGGAVTAATAPAGTPTGIRVAPDNALYATTYTGTPLSDATGALWRGNGTTWAALPAPAAPANGGFGFFRLVGYDTYVRSPSDVWLVGCANCNFQGSGTGDPVLLHWNGTAWTEYSSPLEIGILNRIAGTAAGPTYVSSLNGELPPISSSLPVANPYLIWNGASWDASLGAVVGSQKPYGLAVAAVPGTAVTVAVGRAYLGDDPTHDPYVPRIERIVG